MRVPTMIRRLISKLLTCQKGQSNSLIESAAAIGVGAVLAAGAIGAGGNVIIDAQYQRAAVDVKRIGEGVLTFYGHNNFYPLFRDGSLTGAQNDGYGQLVSFTGTYPAADFTTPAPGAPLAVGT